MKLYKVGASSGDWEYEKYDIFWVYQNLEDGVWAGLTNQGYGKLYVWSDGSGITHDHMNDVVQAAYDHGFYTDNVADFRYVYGC
mmetsp:Transcript_21045/g.18354  ORF Transcript_21045/g.18354 Transcript_21045/m.18354 type:complete len:84 (+) Transcript_21045:250-501(+)